MTVVFVARLPNLLYYSKMDTWTAKAEADSFTPINDGLEITALGTQHYRLTLNLGSLPKHFTSLWF